MTPSLIPIKNPALEYLKSHSSTKDCHIQTLEQFFTYLKDSILSLFNSDHKFAYLGNKSIADFNLEHIKTDLIHFLENKNLNNLGNKDKEGALNYSFKYSSIEAGILPNLYHVYRSGSIEPNDLISQLINYHNKFHQQKLSTAEQQHAPLAIKILEEINHHLTQLPNTENMTSKIANIHNK